MNLIKKELISIISSGTGLIFSLVFLIACGTILWLFPGSLNLLDAGYATTDKFFQVASLLLLILTPALTMRTIAEEKRSRTLDLLTSHPVSLQNIIISKWLATLIYITLILLSTLIYVYTLYILGNPIGNIDFSVTILSYASLISLASVFISIGIFASSVSKNQIVAFVLGLILNFFFFYGFDLISYLTDTATIQSIINSYSISYHLSRVQRGLVYINDVILIVGYITISILATKLTLQTRKSIKLLGSVIVLVILIPLSTLFITTRFDLTSDKRYTISNYTKELMQKIGSENTTPITINLYLDGELNAGFQRLRNSTLELLSDLNEESGNKLNVTSINPNSLPVQRELLPEFMERQNMPAIQLNEIDRNGKMSRQLIYPYLQITDGKDTLQVTLLKNNPGNTAEENLNLSAGNIEFQVVDVLRLLHNKEGEDIAFIEGHGELSRAYVYNAEESLAKYFNINRGQIGTETGILDNFKVVIIAGSTEQFNEQEKYILDQYLMQGGRILWIIDGVKVSMSELVEKGQSASIKNDLNLDDQLFTYGIRINSVLVQDALCTTLPVAANDGSYINMPWYYSPLLLPSPDNVVTKGIAEVKASFVSSIDFVGSSQNLKRSVLLTTANHSRVVAVPELIDFDIEKIQNDPAYFNNAFLPIAVTLEGKFNSAYTNRLIPEGVISATPQIPQSINTKMAVIASSNIIRNDIEGQGQESKVLPMGFDRLSGRQYGNKDFIINLVNWLANDKEVIKSKTRQMHLLDKQKIYNDRNKYVGINILVPLIIIWLLTLLVSYWRKRKYS